MNFNENLTRKVKIIGKTILSSSSLSSSLSSFPALATTTKTPAAINVKTKISNTATAKVFTAKLVYNKYNNTNSSSNDSIFCNKKIFILSFATSCASFIIYTPAMPTSPHNNSITQLSYSMGMCALEKFNTIKPKKIPTTFRTTQRKHDKQVYQSPRTRTARTDIAEVMLPPLASMSSQQKVHSSWPYSCIDRDAEYTQFTAYRTDKTQSSLVPPPNQQLQQTLSTAATKTTTIARRTTSCVPLLATTAAAAEKCSRKQCLSSKIPLSHLILTIITIAVFSMEFTICASSILQQQLTSMTLRNETHLPTATTNKSTNINNNLQNLPVTSKTTTSATITSTREDSLLLSSYASPSSTTSTSSTTTTSASLSFAPLETRTTLSMQSAALVKKQPSASSLKASTLDDSSSNLLSFLTGTAPLMHTELPAHSSLQWEDDDHDGSSELSLSTSILNTYDASDLPPLSEAEQAAKDLLTKGFSIPTYLPPFPVFAVADLPAYLNTVSTTTTESPVSHHRPSDGYDSDGQENFLYFDNLTNHQLRGEHHNHHKLQILNKNKSMTSANVTVQVGSHAYLPCHIHRLQNKPVSWVRLRDGHIISVDQTTFIADQRFQAIFQDDKEFTWSLQIKYVHETDQGWYECQASSEPKMSAKVYLKVIVPLTELIGDQSRFVKAGSKVALHCIVRGTLDPPQYIIWFRDKAQIGDNNKMGWYTQLDRNIFGNNGDNQNTIGSLIIPFVRKVDSGNYTCQPSNSASVSVDLHVLSGEYSASAIMSAARTNKLNDYYLWLLLFLLMLFHKT